MGIRDIRLFGISVIDTVLTLLGAYYISPNNTIAVFVLLVFVSIFIHALFHVETKLTNLLGIKY